MSGRRDQSAWWQELARSERFNGAEWLLLAVSVFALAGAVVVFVRIVT
ncbi:MAG: hypothetical protein CALGDGBN_00340 [Pseudomonadales bacterium]|nr:hypothetical protein [Pseudomonadales bacterium]